MCQAIPKGNIAVPHRTTFLLPQQRGSKVTSKARGVKLGENAQSSVSVHLTIFERLFPYRPGEYSQKPSGGRNRRRSRMPTTPLPLPSPYSSTLRAAPVLS